MTDNPEPVEGLAKIIERILHENADAAIAGTPWTGDDLARNIAIALKSATPASAEVEGLIERLLWLADNAEGFNHDFRDAAEALTRLAAVEAERDAHWLIFDHISKLYITDESKARELDRALACLSVRLGV